MPTLIDLNAELAKLKMLRNRTPQMTRAERAGSAGEIAPYRDGAVFASKFAGSGGWERHRKGDELVHIVDGAATLHLMSEAGPQTLELTAGMITIVAAGDLASVRCTGRCDDDDRDAAADGSSAHPCRGPADARRSIGIMQDLSSNSVA